MTWCFIAYIVVIFQESRGGGKVPVGLRHWGLEYLHGLSEYHLRDVLPVFCLLR